MHLPATLLYGGLCGLLMTALALNVSRMRGRLKASIGEVPPGLIRPVRAHANSAEYIPIALVLLLALEVSGVNTFWLHVLGGTLVLGRTLHAIGLLFQIRVSFFGTVATQGVIITESILAIRRALGR